MRAAFLLILSGCSVNLYAYQQAVLNNPNDAQAWSQLATAYERSGNDELASNARAEAARIDPNAPGAGKQGFPAGSPQAAVFAEPYNDEVWGDLGDWYIERGQTEAAVTAYIRASTLDPADSEWTQKLADYAPDYVIPTPDWREMNDDEAVGDVADALAASDNWDEACQAYAYALELDPEDGEWKRALTRCGAEYRPDWRGMTDDEMVGDVADALWETGSFDEACEAWTYAAELDPDDNEWANGIRRCDLQKTFGAELTVKWNTGDRSALCDQAETLQVDEPGSQAASIVLDACFLAGLPTSASSNNSDPNLRSLYQIVGKGNSKAVVDLIDNDALTTGARVEFLIFGAVALNMPAPELGERIQDQEASRRVREILEGEPTNFNGLVPALQGDKRTAISEIRSADPELEGDGAFDPGNYGRFVAWLKLLDLS